LAEAMEQKQKPGLLPGWLFLLLCQFSFSPDDWTYNNRHCPANCVKQIKLIKCILPIDLELIVRVCVCVLSVWCTPESWLSCVQWGYAEARRKKVTNLSNFFQTYQVEKKSVQQTD
jgi:hypothetical protein